MPVTCYCLVTLRDENEWANHMQIAHGEGTMTTRILNLFCKAGAHNDCPGVSNGLRGDNENFACTCVCHAKS